LKATLVARASLRLSNMLYDETGLVKSVEIRAKADKQMLEPCMKS